MIRRPSGDAMKLTLSFASPSPCPSAEELGAFALAKLPLDAQERVAGHVESCTRCQDALETKTSQTDPLLQDVRHAAALGPLSEPRPPGVLAGYEIVRELGRGGMGIVYLARQQVADRLVALKQVHADALAGLAATEREQVLKRFRSEAQAAGRLTHDHLLPVFEVGEAGGLPFYTMPYAAGGSLAALLRDSGPLPPRQAAEKVEGVARAVQYAHEQGIVHRDLKPHNILIGADGRAYVADFGLAKQLDRNDGHTCTGRALGTLGYAAPEQVRDASRAGVASDVYGLGATLYALLTGRPPFQAASDAEVLDHVRWHDPVPPRQLNPSVPVDLETIALKCLHKEPARRYASAGDLAEDLRRYLAGEPVRARRVNAAERLWRWCRRQPALAGALAAALVGLIATTVVSSALAVEKSNEAERRTKDAEDLAKLVREKQEYADASRDLADSSFDLLGRVGSHELFSLAAHYKDPRGLPPHEPELNLSSEIEPTLIRRATGGDGLDLLDRALSRLETLNPSDAAIGGRRHILAYYCSALGRRARDTQRPEEAERLFRLAIPAWERYTNTHPNDADAINELANCLYFQGAIARERGREEETEASWKRAVAISQPIAGKQPEFASNLGRVYYNLGVFAATRGRADEVIEWQTKAIDTLAPLLLAGFDPPTKWFLSEAYVGRGVEYHNRKDDIRALADLQQAAERATGDRRKEINAFIDKELKGK
jgi:tetratricopeptide (TPR) repeat protein/predicted Ser/Thr protein kinase